jgi:hypothetical protein
MDWSIMSSCGELGNSVSLAEMVLNFPEKCNCICLKFGPKTAFHILKCRLVEP